MFDEGEEAFATFVSLHEGRLRIALMASYGPDRGREAVAEALAYAWEHWGEVRQMERPVGYLFRVGQSKTRSRLRPRPDAAPPRAVPWVEPELPAALQRLSTKQRMAVVLVHAYGWTQREAAEVMAVSEATVRTHLHRGLEKLRTSLGVESDV